MWGMKNKEWEPLIQELRDQMGQQQEKLNVLLERLDVQERECAELKVANQYLKKLADGGLREELTEYMENQRHKSWHMQYTYDNMISHLALENIENKVPGNKKWLESFRGKHEGQRCFVIGNGPSLRAEDLDKLKGELTFGVNKITEIFKYTDWRPTYYMVSDPLYFVDQNERIAELIDHAMLLLPSEFLTQVDSNYVKRIVWYYPIRRYSIIPEFSNCPDKFVYEGGSVLYKVIQFAVYMGIKEVYLLGVDNNYKRKVLPDGREILDAYQKIHFY